ncbi:MAG TPA: hypothetical protein VF142_19375 [Longimicrobium sp.]
MAQAEERDEGRSRRRQRRKGHRRWCLPPPVDREPGEMLAGSYVLNELPAGRALLLWLAVRDVTLWGETDPGERAGLFAPGAEGVWRGAMAAARPEPGLDLPLSTLAGVVTHAAQADAVTISRACLQVAGWAQGQGAMGTAVAFAQAASFAHPDAAHAALAAGRLTLEWGRDRRAETWLRRAIGLARRAGEWESYGWAYVALGEMYERAGRMEVAGRVYLQAARLARRQGYRALRGQATHGMLRTSLAAGRLDEADAWAFRAERCYEEDTPRMHAVRYDVARLRVARGEHEEALLLLRRLLDGITDPARKAVCHALLAHAAAACDQVMPYERGWTEAWELLDAPAAAPSSAEVLRHLGKAAALRGDWLRVRQVVARFAALRDGQRDGELASELAELRSFLVPSRRPQ